MALTDKQVHDLNNMNVAAQRADLGNLVSLLEGKAFGTHIVTETEESASLVELETGLDSVSSWIIQINSHTGGSPVTGDAKVSVSTAGSIITVENGDTHYVTSASNIISYIIM